MKASTENNNLSYVSHLQYKIDQFRIKLLFTNKINYPMRNEIFSCQRLASVVYYFGAVKTFLYFFATEKKNSHLSWGTLQLTQIVLQYGTCVSKG